MFKKLVSLIFIFVVGFVTVLTAQERKISKLHNTIKDLKCSACHECVNPTTKNPCLKLKDSFFLDKDIKISRDRLPADSIIIYEIEEKYGPVKFDHNKHLHMAETLGDCADCHHHTPLKKKFPKCSECHEPDFSMTNLAEIELKAAYHRKCVGCHVEWSKKTDCNYCHSTNGKNGEKTSYTRPALRQPKKPNELVYFCRYFEGPYVKFSHEKHSTKQQLVCADCHTKGKCIACHYQNAEQPPSISVLARKGVHGTCMLCHDVDNKEKCGKCHLKNVDNKSSLINSISIKKFSHQNQNLNKTKKMSSKTMN
ncbi:MAG: cytochrome c3 family protein [Calditrichaeota bacterium]|nr:cytochrome c3 family protein [Calditrichota bacterium]